MIAHAEQGDGGVCAVVTGVQFTTHRQTPHTQQPGLTHTHDVFSVLPMCATL